jgi:nucleotide-binding universal stress UspA family protein
VEPEIDYTALGHPTKRHASQRIARLFEELRHELDDEARHASVPRHRRTSVVRDTVLLRGEPAPTILDYAATHGNDLIVVGTRRVRAGDTLSVGSVAVAILRGAPYAVLVARASSRRRVAGPTDPFFKAHHTAT